MIFLIYLISILGLVGASVPPTLAPSTPPVSLLPTNVPLPVSVPTAPLSIIPLSTPPSILPMAGSMKYPPPSSTNGAAGSMRYSGSMFGSYSGRSGSMSGSYSGRSGSMSGSYSGRSGSMSGSYSGRSGSMSGSMRYSASMKTSMTPNGPSKVPSISLTPVGQPTMVPYFPPPTCKPQKSPTHIPSKTTPAPSKLPITVPIGQPTIVPTTTSIISDIPILFQITQVCIIYHPPCIMYIFCHFLTHSHLNFPLDFHL